MLLDNFSIHANGGATKGFDASSTGINATFDQTRLYAYYNTATRGTYIDIGFGNTAAQKSDYKLEDSNIIDESLAITHLSGGILTNTPYIRTVYSVYQNNTNDTYTIKEIGLCVKGAFANSLLRNAIIARTVLSEPIVMNPGDTYTFTYSIEC